jgi:hypothetical protein
MYGDAVYIPFHLVFTNGKKNAPSALAPLLKDISAKIFKIGKDHSILFRE